MSDGNGAKVLWIVSLCDVYESVITYAVFDDPDTARDAVDEITPGLTWELRDVDGKFGACTEWNANWGDDCTAWAVYPVAYGAIKLDEYEQRKWRRAKKMVGARRLAGREAGAVDE